MPKARIPPRSTGPVKATSTAVNKNITPAWTGMIGVPEVPTSKAFVYADNDDDEDDDNLSVHLRSDVHSISRNSINSIRNSNAGFNLKNSMNALNLNQFVDNSDMIFQKRNQVNNSSLLYSDNVKRKQELGPIEPNISNEFEKLVLSGNYVDFPQVALLIGHASNLEQAEALLKRDILAWLDCFMMYLLVISSTCPGRVSNLLRYSRVILWIYKEAPDNSAWWRYDKAYRRMAAIKGNTDWSSIEEEMFSGAASEKFRLTMHCVDCLTNNHLNVKCPFQTNTLVKNQPPAKNQLPARVTPQKLEITESPQRNDQIEKALANPEKSARKPQEGLQLKYAFGYHGYNSCNNLFYTQSNEIVFHTAGVGVIYNQQTHEQRFYMGHDDDILCLTIHDDQDLIATGQIGRQPCTHVWDIVSLKNVAVLKGFHKRGIICVDFSGDGEMLADVGLDDDHCICVWNWKKQEKLATTRGHKDVIYNLEWNPYEVNKFASVGVKHIKFWTIVDRKIEKRTTNCGKPGELTDMLCICHSPQEDLCYTGAASGEIYVWQGSTYRKAIPAHKGPVYAIFAILQSKDKGFVSGGKDGVVVVWDEMFSQALRAFKIETSQFPPGTILLRDCPEVRSIHTDEGNILVGTGSDEIIQIHYDGSMEMILQGHGEGELWGLAVHPFEFECATVSDDQTLRIWNLGAHIMKKVAVLKKGGRCVCYHPNGETMAVGLNDGSFMIMDSKTLKTLVLTKDRNEEISDIKFSPDGVYLGVASHDNMLDVYHVKKGRKKAVCKGNSSYLTHFDWSKDGRLIQTNSGAREHLLFEIPSGMRKTMGTDVVIRLEWADFTCVIGPTVKGIYPPLTDVTDVNTSNRTKDYKLLATGDDFGLVKIFQYPVLMRGAKCRTYKGHCSHVTNVKWTCDDRFLLSTGGMDATLLLWERVPAGQDFQEEDTDIVVQPKFIPTGPVS
ncbi:echinoderm microtubule-associated protein-like 6 [Hydra vulgaris]|uniref:Echinoderm microtubule-associated protein-like 6 n=1 Tax=Hydra vulgaris TaxID=6087 RepID=A0ABM4C6J4_HYDVU